MKAEHSRHARIASDMPPREQSCRASKKGSLKKSVG